jgi:hypothetical protein
MPCVMGGSGSDPTGFAASSIALGNFVTIASGWTDVSMPYSAETLSQLGGG